MNAGLQPMQRYLLYFLKLFVIDNKLWYFTESVKSIFHVDEKLSTMMFAPALKTCDLQANEKQMESMKKEEEAKKADSIVRCEETRLILLSTKKKTFCSKWKQF